MPLTLIFCFDDGEVAKVMAKKIERPVWLRDARAFDARNVESCDRVVFSPAVPERLREAIKAGYQSDFDRRMIERRARQERGDWAPPEFPTPKMIEDFVPLTYRHVTQGRWYVFRGKERASGPHTKEQARTIAERGLDARLPGADRQKENLHEHS